MRKWWIVGIAGAVLARLVWRWPRQKNILVLYGSPDRDWVAAVAEKFEKETKIKVQWIRASSNERTRGSRRTRRIPRGMCGSAGPGIPISMLH